MIYQLDNPGVVIVGCVLFVGRLFKHVQVFGADLTPNDGRCINLGKLVPKPRGIFHLSEIDQAIGLAYPVVSSVDFHVVSLSPLRFLRIQTDPRFWRVQIQRGGFAVRRDAISIVIATNCHVTQLRLIKVINLKVNGPLPEDTRGLDCVERWTVQSQCAENFEIAQKRERCR